MYERRNETNRDINVFRFIAFPTPSLSISLNLSLSRSVWQCIFILFPLLLCDHRYGADVNIYSDEQTQTGAQ